MNFTNIIFYSLIAGFSTIFGTILVFYNESWTKKNSVFLISFAAGIMLTISFLHLLPEAKESVDNVWVATFIGFLCFYILQNIVMFHPCNDEECKIHRIGFLSFVGLALHSFLDGVAISVGFEASHNIGILTTLAVLLHEVPEGITITGILLHSKITKIKIWIYSVIVALATPLGAISSYFFLKNISKNLLGFLLAFTAGSFIYLASADLLPETHKQHHRVNIIFFFFGVALIILVSHLLH
ncbi:MAG: ZIP family metal transporter [Endomicrobiia bacterium]